MILVLAAFLLQGSAQAAAWVSTAAEVQKFATESSPAPRFKLNARHTTDSHDFYLHSFFEPGPQGEYSVDLDPAVVRWAPETADGHLWLGRAHPQQEGFIDGSVLTTTAIGSRWAQTRIDPLNPRVSGWIGMGLHAHPANGAFFTISYSPIFLPSFDPNLDLSETSSASGSRFARLPPARVRVNGSDPLPLRYKLEQDSLNQILLQNQGFVSAGYANKSLRAQGLIWSAPQPDPEIDASGVLQIESQSDAHVLVTARPKFPRRNYLGALVQMMSIPLQPEIQFLYEPQLAQSTASITLTPAEFLSLGFMHEWQKQRAAPLVSSPHYADRLVWASLVLWNNRSIRWKPTLRVESHLTPGAGDLWVRPALRYEASQALTILASVSILSGEDRSHYGQWRSLDQVATGVQYLW